jgi:hypothetical protein
MCPQKFYLQWALRCNLGGLAVILALGFEPVTQNLIHYYLNGISDPSQRSYLPILQYMLPVTH